MEARAEARHEGAAATAWQKAVRRAVTNLGVLAAPGPSGLRPEHLRLALQTRSCAEDVEILLAEFVDHICAGRVSRGLRDCALSGIPKPRSTTLRPIGAGDILRRMATSLAAHAISLSPVATELEAHGQLCLAPHGALRASRRVHDMARRGLWIIAIDSSNAFNSIRRHRILHAMRGILGEAITRALYDHVCRMWVRGGAGEHIRGEEGVVQGCGLGMVLFAKGQDAILEDARKASAFDRTIRVVTSRNGGPPPGFAGEAAIVEEVWIADDGHIGSTSLEALERYFAEVVHHMRGGGLEVARKKTQIMRPPGLDGTPLPATIADYCEEVDVLRALGSPVARGGAITPALRSWFSEFFAEKAVKVRAIAQLSHPQFVLRALQQAGAWQRIQYALAGQPKAIAVAVAFPPPDAQATSLQTVIDAQTEVLKVGVLRDFGAALHAQGLRQAYLPCKLGGLGITDASAAFGNGAACDETLAAVESAEQGAFNDARAAANRARARHSNRHQRDYDGLLDDPAMTLADKARLRALAANDAVIASAWLSGPMQRRLGLLQDEAEASAAMALRLGIRVYSPTDPPGGTHECPLPCNTGGLLDEDGRHAWFCSNIAVSRHDGIRDVVFLLLAGALPKGRVLREQACGPDGLPTKVRKLRGVKIPGDVAFRLSPTDPWVYVDVRVTGPRNDLLVKASKDGTVCSSEAYAEKNSGLAARQVRGTAAVFEALALGAYGDASPTTRDLIKRIGGTVDHYSDFLPTCGRLKSSRLLQCRISHVLVRASARAVLKAREVAGMAPLSVAPMDAPAALPVQGPAQSVPPDPPDPDGMRGREASVAAPAHSGLQTMSSHEDNRPPRTLVVRGSQIGNVLAPGRAVGALVPSAFGQPVPTYAQATTGLITAAGSSASQSSRRVIPADVTFPPPRSGPDIVRGLQPSLR